MISWTSPLGMMQTLPRDSFLVCCYKVLLYFNHFILPCLLEGGGWWVKFQILNLNFGQISPHISLY